MTALRDHLPHFAAPLPSAGDGTTPPVTPPAGGVVSNTASHPAQARGPAGTPGSGVPACLFLQPGCTRADASLSIQLALAHNIAAFDAFEHTDAALRALATNDAPRALVYQWARAHAVELGLL